MVLSFMAKSLSKIWNNRASDKRRSGDSAASDAHYVFLIIGCFLTIAVCLGLNVFSKSFVHSEINKITTQTIAAYFQELDHRRVFFEFLGGILEFSDVDGVPELQERLLRPEANVLLENFDRVLLYYRERDVVVVETLYQPDFSSSRLWVDANLDAFDEVFEEEGLLEGGISLDFPLFRREGDTAGRKAVVAFVHKLNIDSVGKALIVGVGRSDGVISDDWVEKYPLLDYIDVRDVESYKQLYKYQRKGGSFLEYRMHDLDVYETEFGGVDWEVKTRFRKEGIIFILESIPWIGAFLGAFLTIFAAAYAYIQQKQSRHMLIMNWALEDKNAELEHENEKREILNQNLKKSEEENRAVIDSISDIIFETNVDGEIVYANAAWPRITGFNMVQSKGQSLFNLLHPKDQDEERERFSLLVRGEQMAYRTLTRLRTRDGMLCSVRLS